MSASKTISISQHHHAPAERCLTPEWHDHSRALSSTPLCWGIGQGRYTRFQWRRQLQRASRCPAGALYDRGSQAQLNYTWSKCLSDTPGFFGQGYGDNVATEAQTIAGGPSRRIPTIKWATMADAPQTLPAFNGYVVYELPYGHGREFGNGSERHRKRRSPEDGASVPELHLPQRICPDYFRQQRHVGHGRIFHSCRLLPRRSVESR